MQRSAAAATLPRTKTAALNGLPPGHSDQTRYRAASLSSRLILTNLSCLRKIPDQRAWMSSQEPVPTPTTRPATMREAGDARSSVEPLSVASVKKCAAVSKVTLRKGDALPSMPMRFSGWYPPCAIVTSSSQRRGASTVPQGLPGICQIFTARVVSR